MSRTQGSGKHAALSPSKIDTDVATSTTNNTYSVINGMTIIPGAGDYMVFFSCSGGPSIKSSDSYLAVFVDGVMVDDSERRVVHGGNHNHPLDIPLSTITHVNNVGGGEAIDVRYKTAGGTFSVGKRSLNLIRMG
jgi:hypothetical protein